MNAQLSVPTAREVTLAGKCGSAARSQLQVLQKGPGRASVVGAHRDSAEASALEAWLAERIDVARFEQRLTGTFHVVYDDGAALAGRFMRSLRDKIHAINRGHVAPEPFGIEPVHSLPGRVRLRVKGISERQLDTLTMLTAGLPGVTHTKHIPGGRTALVIYDPEKVSEEAILEALLKTDPSEWARDWHKPTPIRWGGALSGTWVLFMCITRSASFPWLAFGVALNTLRPLWRSLEALREGEISIDLLDVAATFAALATGRPTTAAFVIWMVGVGDLLLDISANKTRSALSTLMQRGEREALRLLPDGKLEPVPVDDLEVGDQFIVHTGHGIVADGTVVSGLAEVDEKALTGESHLLSKKTGDPVFASTVVVEGHLVVRVESSGTNTEAAKIETILNTVGSKPLTLQRDALEFASKLVLPTFGVAALAAALAGDVTRAVCVLITDFGTGIRIAVPTSALTAMALAAREGVLVKGAQYLERLSKTDVIVFDKTGTLTRGVPEVVEVVTARGVQDIDPHDALRIRGGAIRSSRRDRAEIVREGARHRDGRAGAGKRRVRGRARTLRARSRSSRARRSSDVDGEPEARHRPRVQEAPRALQASARFESLRRGRRPRRRARRVLGRNAARERGDRARAASRRTATSRAPFGRQPGGREAVARAVGIDEAVGGLLPEEKAEYVRRMRDAGCVVAMVGDGINDAPALAQADVGISIAGSTDVALETADVVLLDGGLARLEKAFRISDRAMSSVRQNLGIIIVPNAIAIALGAAGLIKPPLAAIINNGATFAAVLARNASLFSNDTDHVNPRSKPDDRRCRSPRTPRFASSCSWHRFPARGRAVTRLMKSAREWWSGKKIAVIGPTASGKDSFLARLQNRDIPHVHANSPMGEKVDSFKVKLALSHHQVIDITCKGVINIGGETDYRDAPAGWLAVCEDADVIFYVMTIKDLDEKRFLKGRRIREDLDWLHDGDAAPEEGRAHPHPDQQDRRRDREPHRLPRARHGAREGASRARQDRRHGASPVRGEIHGRDADLDEEQTDLHARDQRRAPRRVLRVPRNRETTRRRRRDASATGFFPIAISATRSSRATATETMPLRRVLDPKPWPRGFSHGVPTELLEKCAPEDRDEILFAQRFPNWDGDKELFCLSTPAGLDSLGTRGSHRHAVRSRSR